MPVHLRNTNTGAGQNFTDLAAVVQLRLCVAVFADGHYGLQTLAVKSRLLTGEKCLRTAIRCDSEATHQFEARIAGR